MNGNAKLMRGIKFHGADCQASIETLSKCSSRDVTKYEEHIKGRLLTSSVLIKVMSVKNHRRRKFQAYQTGQQAVTKLATVILEEV